MRWRTAWGCIGALALVCLAMVLSVWYPFAPETVPTEDPIETSLSDAHSDGYAYELTYTVDGTVVSQIEGWMTADGSAVSFSDEDSTRTQYFDDANGTLYVRSVFTDPKTAALNRDDIREDDDRELVRETKADGRTTFVVRTRSDGLDPAPGLFAHAPFRRIPFERGERTAESVTYQPANGWIEARDPYRVTGASGTIHLDTETNSIRTADVTWIETAPAETYAQYLITRVAGDETDRQRHEFTFDLETGVDATDEPDWLDDQE